MLAVNKHTVGSISRNAPIKPDSLSRWGQAARWRGGCQPTFWVCVYSHGKCQWRPKADKFTRCGYLKRIKKIRRGWSNCQIWPKDQSLFCPLAKLVRMFHELLSRDREDGFACPPSRACSLRRGGRATRSRIAECETGNPPKGWESGGQFRNADGKFSQKLVRF